MKGKDNNQEYFNLIYDKLLRISRTENKTKIIKEICQTRVCDIVCNHFRCTKEELFRKSRKGHIVFQRHITQYLLMNHSPLGCKAIGDYFGQDHTTVLHAYKSIKKEVEHKFENNYKSHIEELINKMKYES
jgi:chromosomal replication initiation ATPase DnaA